MNHIVGNVCYKVPKSHINIGQGREELLNVLFELECDQDAFHVLSLIESLFSSVTKPFTCRSFHGDCSLINTRKPELDTFGNLNFKSCRND